jgi:uncharacterized protein with FMN-binding domain
MAKKIPRRLVALSSSAIATIYFAGLLSTRAAADTVSTTTVSTAAPAATTVSTAVAATSVPTVVVGASAPSTPVSSASASTGYPDGTFSGTGSGKFGSITVAVTTSGGKIATVQITKVATTFPVSQIASLPGQVVQTQSATVSAVTGATASSQAFKQAVQQALAQAAAAKSTTATA